MNMNNLDQFGHKFCVDLFIQKLKTSNKKGPISLGSWRCLIDMRFFCIVHQFAFDTWAPGFDFRPKPMGKTKTALGFFHVSVCLIWQQCIPCSPGLFWFLVLALGAALINHLPKGKMKIKLKFEL